MPEMKTILVGSTDSAISVAESLQDVEKHNMQHRQLQLDLSLMRAERDQIRDDLYGV